MEMLLNTLMPLTIRDNELDRVWKFSQTHLEYPKVIKEKIMTKIKFEDLGEKKNWVSGRYENSSLNKTISIISYS